MKRIIRFTASWCQPCKSLAKTLESIQTDLPIEVYDIDEHTDYASTYGIRSVPTLIMLEGNDEIKRMSGTKPQKELETWLND